MKKSPSPAGRLWTILRRTSSAAVLSVFALGLALPAGLLSTAAETIAALQLAPLLFSVFSAGSVLTAAVLLVHVLLAAVFGRFYCSSLCPLGTLQDVFGFAVRKARAKRRPAGFAFRRERRGFRFALLAAVVLSAAAGFPVLAALLDPASLAGRFFRDLAAPGAAALAGFAAPLFKGLGFRLPLREPLFNPGLFFLALAAASGLFSLVVFRGRLFCSLLCPVGSFLRLAAARPLFRLSLAPGRCTRCGACERACPAECIDAAAGTIDQGRCLRCGRCMNACTEKAVVFGRLRPDPASAAPLGRNAAEKQAPPNRAAAAGRRDFLKILGAGSAALGLASAAAALLRLGGKHGVLSFPRRLEPPVLIDGAVVDRLPAAVPPGAESRDRFGGSCTACGLCSARCPTGVLRPAVFTAGLAGLFQPILDYEAGFCEYDCVECGRVCPAGAILPLQVRTKQRTRIGLSHLLEDRCVVFTKGTSCGACAEVCPTHAVHMDPYKPGLAKPATDASLCIGCGSCQFACPVEGTKAILVKGEAVHSLIDDRKNRPAGSPDTAKPATTKAEDDFPF